MKIILRRVHYLILSALLVFLAIVIGLHLYLKPTNLSFDPRLLLIVLCFGFSIYFGAVYAKIPSFLKFYLGPIFTGGVGFSIWGFDGAIYGVSISIFIIALLHGRKY